MALQNLIHHPGHRINSRTPQTRNVLRRRHHGRDLSHRANLDRNMVIKKLKEHQGSDGGRHALRSWVLHISSIERHSHPYVKATRNDVADTGSMCTFRNCLDGRCDCQDCVPHEQDRSSDSATLSAAKSRSFTLWAWAGMYELLNWKIASMHGQGCRSTIVAR